MKYQKTIKTVLACAILFLLYKGFTETSQVSLMRSALAPVLKSEPEPEPKETPKETPEYHCACRAHVQ